MPLQEEIHEAVVTAVDDPEQRLRIKCKCIGLLADEDAALPMWIEPVLGWGMIIVPDVGETIEIVIASSNDTDDSYAQTSLESPDVRWRGARFWSEDQDGDTPRLVPDDFKTNYGKRRGFATPRGHSLLFDDTEGKEKVTLSQRTVVGGADKFAFVSLDENGSVVMSNRNGSLVYLNALQGQITIVDEFGNSYASDENGLRLIDKFANIVDMSDGDIQLISQGNILEAAADWKASVGSYNLGDAASESAVLGEKLIAWLNAHTHSTGMGPSGPPIVPAIPTDFLSLIGKLE